MTMTKLKKQNQKANKITNSAGYRDSKESRLRFTISDSLQPWLTTEENNLVQCKLMPTWPASVSNPGVFITI